MEDIILIAVLTLLAGGIIFYLVKQKKKGKCVGCPYSKTCGSKCNGNK